MNRRQSVSRWILCGVGVCFLAGTTGSSQTQAPTQTIPLSQFKAITADDIKPTGTSTQVVLYGDPTKAGMYAVQITFAPGRGSRPHFHDQDRFVSVVKGTWYVALGSFVTFFVALAASYLLKETNASTQA